MTAFLKADVQNAGIGDQAYGCFWPKADTRGRVLTPNSAIRQFDLPALISTATVREFGESL